MIYIYILYYTLYYIYIFVRLYICTNLNINLTGAILTWIFAPQGQDTKDGEKSGEKPWDFTLGC